MNYDIFATHEVNGIKYAQGYTLPFGATEFMAGVVNFSISSAHATACTLVLFHKGELQPFAELPVPPEFRTGNTFSLLVFNLDTESTEYGYKLDGPYDPAHGMYFNKEQILLDPYAKTINGHDVWRQREYADSAFPLRSAFHQHLYNWEDDRPLERPIEECIIYELHVRGFTQHANSGAKYPGTYAGIIEKIPYLKQLGINCIELLPVFDFNEREFDSLPDQRETNFWGYSPISFFALKNSYAKLGPNGLAADEFRNMIKRLHQAGIEVILDVVFNHTGEDSFANMRPDQCYNFRGIDGKTYYMLNEDGSDCNYSGCGNTVNCNHPVVRNMILESLRFWVSEYHIDGFRFDEAPILSRDTDGRPMLNPPLLESLAMDPILAKTKLIAEAWDAGGLYQVGSFPAPTRWAEWNGKFRDSLRGFLRSDGQAGRELLDRLQGSPEIFAQKTIASVVNFVTCHDGFTLMDLVSYNQKHNEANGENNRDGGDHNSSWNCGQEGATDDPEILALRHRNIKNAQVITLISRGTPMLLAGDEFGNSQMGNNNAYCQDNEISWLDWSLAEKNTDILSCLQKMIALRKAHPVFRRADFITGHNSSGYPELSFHGCRPWQLNAHEPILTFGMLYAEPKADFPVLEDSFIYIMLNAYWETQYMELPILPEGFVWRKYLDTNEASHTDESVIQDSYLVSARSVVVLLANKT